MNVKANFTTIDNFNDTLRTLLGRNIIYKRPAENTPLNWDVYVFKDGQKNVHLLYKDIINETKKIIHLAYDTVDPERPAKQEKVKNAGRKAFREANKLCQQYQEDLNYSKNKDFIEYGSDDKNIVAFMYHYTNRDIEAQTWHKHCYGYDMNSCFPYFLTKPLPYGDIIRQDDVVGKGEIGFNRDLTYRCDESLTLALEGQRAKYIFKSKVYKGLTTFALEFFNKKKLAKTDEEKDFSKLVLNAFIGDMKYHNIFIRVTVLEYARRYMESLKDENTIIQTVDSIVSLVPRPDLNIGTNLGQFKCEHEDQSFVFKNDVVKRWAGEATKKVGLRANCKKDNFELIQPGYDFSKEQNKIIKVKEIWKRLWEDENQNII